MYELFFKSMKESQVIKVWGPLLKTKHFTVKTGLRAYIFAIHVATTPMSGDFKTVMPSVGQYSVKPALPCTVSGSAD